MTFERRFERFFSGANDGRSPYPWQVKLACRLATEGIWPAAISAPTGAGKSSVIDVHVFAVAEQRRLGRSSRLPRRLVLVAPRRVLVDDQYERALQLAALLSDPNSEPLAEVAEALADLISSAELRPLVEGGPGERISPLGVTRLRGGIRIDRSWRLDPTRCQVICATPQMWGSRLLMRGFGSSARARNLESGLMASDCAVVIDEAHLHGRLLDTARRVAQMEPDSPNRAQIVGMSATQTEADATRLGAADLDHDELRKRVTAPKRVERNEVAGEWKQEASPAVIGAALSVAGSGTVGVFVNTVARAREVTSELEKHGQAVLVCGRMRPADVDRLREEFPGLLDSHGNSDVDFLVSTQSLEVGVDLDLAAMVSEIAPASALAQRLGRLNRSGSRQEPAPFLVVAPAALGGLDPDSIDRDHAPYAGADIVAASAWLDALGSDGSPRSVSALALPPSSKPFAPSITSAEVEVLAMTSFPLATDVEAAFYLEDPEPESHAISIAARDHLTDVPPRVAKAALEAAPPRAHELARVALGNPKFAQAALNTLAKTVNTVWVVRSGASGPSVSRLIGEGEPNGDDPRIPVLVASQIAPGDALVVPSGSRIIKAGIVELAVAAKSDVIDDVTDRRPDPEGPADLIVPLAQDAVESLRVDDPLLMRRASREGLATMLEDEGNEAQVVAAERLRGSLVKDLRLVWCFDAGESSSDAGGLNRGLLVLVSVVRDGALPAAAVSTDPVQLADHCAAVEDRLSSILSVLGESALGIHASSLLSAARHHDYGKGHPEFQARMGSSDRDYLLAKPRPGHVPDRGGTGWRHEQLSAGRISLDDPDGFGHIIGAGHHGCGAPCFDRDAARAMEGWNDIDPEVAAELQRLFGPGGVYERDRARLQERVGVLGLAYLEALLRCADIQISREGR